MLMANANAQNRSVYEYLAPSLVFSRSNFCESQNAQYFAKLVKPVHGHGEFQLACEYPRHLYTLQLPGYKASGVRD